MRERVQPAEAIGSGLVGWRRWAAMLVLVIVLGADLFWHPVFADARRAGAGLLGCAVLFLLARGDRRSVGLVLRPQQGFWYWGKASVVVGGILAVMVGLAGLVLWLVGKPLAMRSMFTHADQIRGVAIHALVVAPVLEEPIYRLVLCVPLAALLGRWPTVFVSGAVFGYLHFHYGNPGPDNFFAGYVLAWAYLHSGTIALPIVLHALGNGIVIAGHTAAFYFA